MDEIEGATSLERALASEQAGESEVATAGAGERTGATVQPLCRQEDLVESAGNCERGKVVLENGVVEVLLSDESRHSFDVVAITAGDGNGWKFSEETLRESVTLWEGVETFIDHGELWAGRSVRDLAGVCSGVHFDESLNGIRLTLAPFGPSAHLLEAIGREWLEMKGSKPKIGFSADLLFTGKGKDVSQIVKVFSLDLVFRPARGGAFLRALNSERDDQPTNGGILDEEILEMENEKLSETEIKGVAIENELLLAMQESLLENKLSQAKLPDALTKQLRKQFSGRVFKVGELDQSILEARELFASLQGGGIIQGGGVISHMVDEKDRIQAATDDLLGAERNKGMDGVKVARLSGIRELYTLLTGDVEMYGKMNPERITLATSDSVSNVLMNAFNKIMISEWEQLGRAGYRWWEKVVSVEHMDSLQPVSGILLGEVSALSSISEGSDYGDLEITDSGETQNFTKYGGLLPITIEMIDKDETHKLRQLPKKLISSAVRNVSDLVSLLFTGSNGTGPIMTDGYHVFDVGHNNIGTTALAAASFEAASLAIYNQALISTATTKPKQALDAKYLLVPRNMRLTAMRILYPTFEREATFFTENMQRGEMGDVITVPNWSDLTDWAAMADPKLAPSIILAERFGVMPEIFVADNQLSNDMIHSDTINLKVRHFLAVFCADYRPLFKANVA
ncbi:MAG: phage major capsid protein [Anaerolineaceae bacterium]